MNLLNWLTKLKYFLFDLPKPSDVFLNPCGTSIFFIYYEPPCPIPPNHRSHPFLNCENHSSTVKNNRLDNSAGDKATDYFLNFDCSLDVDAVDVNLLKLG